MSRREANTTYRGLTVVDLEIVRTTIRHRSMALAAAELGIPASRISRLVGTLERVLGADLILRHPGEGWEPTELGMYFASTAAAAIGALNGLAASVVEKAAARVPHEPHELAVRAAQLVGKRPVQ